MQERERIDALRREEAVGTDSLGRGMCGVLLAGGKSSRMGFDKSMINWKGRSLWRHQMSILESSGLDELLIAGTGEGPWSLEDGEWRVVEDAGCGKGPLAGILSAFEAMRAGWLVCLAVDMPAMTSAYLSEMMAHALASRRGCVPVWEDKPEPLAAVYPRSMAVLARHHLRRGQFSLHRWVRDGVSARLLDTKEVPAKDRFLFSNINTPGDLRTAGFSDQHGAA